MTNGRVRLWYQNPGRSARRRHRAVTHETGCAPAGRERSLYSLEGLKARNSRTLHVTGVLWDAPACPGLSGRAAVVGAARH